MKSGLKTGERRFVRKRPINIMNAIEKNWLHSVQHFIYYNLMAVRKVKAIRTICNITLKKIQTNIYYLHFNKNFVTLELKM